MKACHDAVEDVFWPTLELVDELDPHPGDDKNGTRLLISQLARTYLENMVSSPVVLRFFAVSLRVYCKSLSIYFLTRSATLPPVRRYP